jgi:hypothetical protein
MGEIPGSPRWETREGQSSFVGFPETIAQVEKEEMTVSLSLQWLLNFSTAAEHHLNCCWSSQSEKPSQTQSLFKKTRL